MMEARRMKFPEFFANIPVLKLQDPLAGFLGAAEDGLLEYRYEDVVKLAGHSCPTVASAYWLTYLALGKLYPDGVPQRGGIKVAFCDHREDGVTGVIASVVGMLTGAADVGGFKGISGQFVRRGLLDFETDLPYTVRYTRLDTGASVDAAANLGRVPPFPTMQVLLARCLDGSADAKDREEFAQLWQLRVKRLLIDHADDPEVFVVRAAG